MLVKGIIGQKLNNIMSRAITIKLGDKFKRLTVVKLHGRHKNKSILWECHCVCGNISIVQSSSLISGNSTSCGCYQKERAKLVGEKNKIHGKSKTNIFMSWGRILDRCYNPKNPSYKNYGARGITVCRRWQKFENFFEDMGHRPKGMQIDRINNDKGYYKENCRWVTPKEQANNRRNNKVIVYKGEAKSVREWAKETGISRSIICRRLFTNWTVERTLTQPPRANAK